MRYQVACVGDDGWHHQPSPQHPPLIAQYIGYLEHGYTFRFRLDGYDQVLDDQVDSACWDSLGQLVFSRQGVLYRYSLNDLQAKRSAHILDLEDLAQPSR